MKMQKANKQATMITGVGRAEGQVTAIEEIAWWDSAMYMLQQLRQLCAQPCKLKLQASAHTMQQGAVTVDFGFKATQFILDFWNHSSALECLGASCSHGKVLDEMVPSTDHWSRDHSYSHTTERERRSRQRESAPLRFIIWKEPKCASLQPWNIIPVTHTESARFLNIPVARRHTLLSSEIAEAVETRLLKLSQLYCNTINGPDAYKFTECMFCSPDVYHPSTIDSQLCQSCSTMSDGC
jgi:hypothetical protein